MCLTLDDIGRLHIWLNVTATKHMWGRYCDFYFRDEETEPQGGSGPAERLVWTWVYLIPESCSLFHRRGSKVAGWNWQVIFRLGPCIIDIPFIWHRRDPGDCWGSSDANPVQMIVKDKIQVGSLFFSQTPQWAPGSNACSGILERVPEILENFAKQVWPFPSLGSTPSLLGGWEPSYSCDPSPAPRRREAGFSSPHVGGSWPLPWWWFLSNENIARWTRHKAKQSQWCVSRCKPKKRIWACKVELLRHGIS